MKVVFTVSIFDKPYGGHYHTCRLYRQSLEDTLGCAVPLIVIGNEEPKWLTDKDHFIKYSGLNFLTALQRFKKIAREYDIAHAFDEFAALFARLSRGANIYTRCGGPNPIGRYFPRVGNMICLSNENHEFFSTKLKSSRVEFVPNRVRYFDVNENLINQLHDRYPQLRESTVILRISRIDPYYKRTIAQTVEFARAIRDRHPNVIPVILGKIYDQKFYRALKFENPECTFITDELFTEDAKTLLTVADFVVGTGRSMMESLSLGLPSLSPTADGALPELIHEGNVDHFFEYNFSERASKTEFSKTQLQFVSNLLTDKNQLNNLKHWGKAYAQRHFLLSTYPAAILEQYKDCTQNAKVELRIDHLRHAARVTSVFCRATLRKKLESFTCN